MPLVRSAAFPDMPLPMRLLTEPELRFTFAFAVQQLDPALVRQLRDKNPTRRALSEQIVVDRLMERLRGHEVYAPDPPPGRDFADMDRPA